MLDWLIRRSFLLVRIMRCLGWGLWGRMGRKVQLLMRLLWLRSILDRWKLIQRQNKLCLYITINKYCSWLDCIAKRELTKVLVCELDVDSPPQLVLAFPAPPPGSDEMRYGFHLHSTTKKSTEKSCLHGKLKQQSRIRECGPGTARPFHTRQLLTTPPWIDLTYEPLWGD